MKHTAHIHIHIYIDCLNAIGSSGFMLLDMVQCEPTCMISGIKREECLLEKTKAVNNSGNKSTSK